MPEYRELFTQLLKNGNTDPDPAEIGQIKSLLQKIVNPKALISDPDPPGPDPVPPVIHLFTADKRRLPKGGSVKSVHF
ncbi:MAG TPA: hypothetical protein VHW43_00055 [Puia sp.]|nr:hypothetical protein [Puia sp.]